MSTPRLSLIAFIAAVLAAAAGTAVADPVEPRPSTVTVDVTGDALVVRGHKDATPGYSRLRIRSSAEETYSLAVIELKPGHRPSEVSEIPLAGLQDAERVERIGRLIAGATVDPGDEYATRLVLRRRRFVVVDVGHEDQKQAAFRLKGEGVSLTPGRHDAAVTLRDDRLVVPSALPRRGLVRIANRGDRPHSLTALRLRRGLSTAAAKRKARNGVEPARIGRRFDLLGVVSGGTVNRVEATLPRGRYLLVSYYGGLKGPKSDLSRGLLAGVEVP